MYKITLLTSSDFPYGGAPENFVREMLTGIKKVYSNINLNVILFWGNRYNNLNDTGINCSNYLFKKPFKNNFFKILELFFQILNIPLFMISLKFKFKSDVLILYGIDRSYIVAPIILFSKIINLKCYRIITELYQKKDYAYKWWRLPLVFFNSTQLKFFDKYLDGVIVLSNYLKEICLKNGIKESNIYVIPHFINFNDKEISNQSCIEDDQFDIVYAGTISPENGISDLIEAFLLFREGKKTTLRILGKKNFSLVSEEREKELSLKDVIFTGNLTKNEVSYYCNNASLLVNPRRKSILAESGFPTKIGEYFATQVPVLSTRTGDLKSYFTDSRELYFTNPNDFTMMYKKIDYIYNNREERIQVGKNGFKWGKSNLDSCNNARKLIEFINSNIGKLKR